MRKVALILLTLALASCGTVAGVGEDITGASRTVQGWFQAVLLKGTVLILCLSLALSGCTVARVGAKATKGVVKTTSKVVF